MKIELSPQEIKFIDETAEEVVVETNLIDEEKAIINKGRVEYKKGAYIPLSEINF